MKMGIGGSCEGSYTVEAAFVMSLILYVMVFLIQTAYSECRQAVGTMRLQEMVEILRHQEEDGPAALSKDGAAYRLRAEKGGGSVMGHAEGASWSLDIKSGIYEPEEFMRLLTLIQE